MKLALSAVAVSRPSWARSWCENECSPLLTPVDKLWGALPHGEQGGRHPVQLMLIVVAAGYLAWYHSAKFVAVTGWIPHSGDPVALCQQFATALRVADYRRAAMLSTSGDKSAPLHPSAIEVRGGDLLFVQAWHSRYFEFPGPRVRLADFLPHCKRALRTDASRSDDDIISDLITQLAELWVQPLDILAGHRGLISRALADARADANRREVGDGAKEGAETAGTKRKRGSGDDGDAAVQAAKRIDGGKRKQVGSGAGQVQQADEGGRGDGDKLAKDGKRKQARGVDEQAQEDRCRDVTHSYSNAFHAGLTGRVGVGPYTWLHGTKLKKVHRWMVEQGMDPRRPMLLSREAGTVPLDLEPSRLARKLGMLLPPEYAPRFRDDPPRVGLGVYVFWAADGCWYSGVVASHTRSPFLIVVAYDDGDRAVEDTAVTPLVRIPAASPPGRLAPGAPIVSPGTSILLHHGDAAGAELCVVKCHLKATRYEVVRPSGGRSDAVDLGKCRFMVLGAQAAARARETSAEAAAGWASYHNDLLHSLELLLLEDLADVFPAGVRPLLRYTRWHDAYKQRYGHDRCPSGLRHRPLASPGRLPPGPSVRQQLLASGCLPGALHGPIAACAASLIYKPPRLLGIRRAARSGWSCTQAMQRGRAAHLAAAAAGSRRSMANAAGARSYGVPAASGDAARRSAGSAPCGFNPTGAADWGRDRIRALVDEVTAQRDGPARKAPIRFVSVNRQRGRAAPAAALASAAGVPSHTSRLEQQGSKHAPVCASLPQLERAAQQAAAISGSLAAADPADPVVPTAADPEQTALAELADGAGIDGGSGSSSYGSGSTSDEQQAAGSAPAAKAAGAPSSIRQLLRKVRARLQQAMGSKAIPEGLTDEQLECIANEGADRVKQRGKAPLVAAEDRWRDAIVKEQEAAASAAVDGGSSPEGAAAAHESVSSSSSASGNGSSGVTSCPGEGGSCSGSGSSGATSCPSEGGRCSGGDSDQQQRPATAAEMAAMAVELVLAYDVPHLRRYQLLPCFEVHLPDHSYLPPFVTEDVVLDYARQASKWLQAGSVGQLELDTPSPSQPVAQLCSMLFPAAMPYTCRHLLELTGGDVAMAQAVFFSSGGGSSSSHDGQQVAAQGGTEAAAAPSSASVAAGAEEVNEAVASLVTAFGPGVHQMRLSVLRSRLAAFLPAGVHLPADFSDDVMLARVLQAYEEAVGGADGNSARDGVGASLLQAAAVGGADGNSARDGGAAEPAQGQQAPMTAAEVAPRRSGRRAASSRAAQEAQQSADATRGTRKAASAAEMAVAAVTVLTAIGGQPDAMQDEPRAVLAAGLPADRFLASFVTNEVAQSILQGSGWKTVGRAGMAPQPLPGGAVPPAESAAAATPSIHSGGGNASGDAGGSGISSADHQPAEDTGTEDAATEGTAFAAGQLPSVGKAKLKGGDWRRSTADKLALQDGFAASGVKVDKAPCKPPEKPGEDEQLRRQQLQVNLQAKIATRQMCRLTGAAQLWASITINTSPTAGGFDFIREAAQQECTSRSGPTPCQSVRATGSAPSAPTATAEMGALVLRLRGGAPREQVPRYRQLTAALCTMWQQRNVTPGPWGLVLEGKPVAGLRAHVPSLAGVYEEAAANRADERSADWVAMSDLADDKMRRLPVYEATAARAARDAWRASSPAREAARQAAEPPRYRQLAAALCAMQQQRSVTPEPWRLVLEGKPVAGLRAHAPSLADVYEADQADLIFKRSADELAIKDLEESMQRLTGDEATAARAARDAWRASSPAREAARQAAEPPRYRYRQLAAALCAMRQQRSVTPEPWRLVLEGKPVAGLRAHVPSLAGVYEEAAANRIDKRSADWVAMSDLAEDSWQRLPADEATAACEALVAFGAVSPRPPRFICLATAMCTIWRSNNRAWQVALAGDLLSALRASGETALAADLRTNTEAVTQLGRLCMGMGALDAEKRDVVTDLMLALCMEESPPIDRHDIEDLRAACDVVCDRRPSDNPNAPEARRAEHGAGVTEVVATHLHTDHTGEMRTLAFYKALVDGKFRLWCSEAVAAGMDVVWRTFKTFEEGEPNIVRVKPGQVYEVDVATSEYRLVCPAQPVDRAGSPALLPARQAGPSAERPRRLIGFWNADHEEGDASIGVLVADLHTGMVEGWSGDVCATAVARSSFFGLLDQMARAARQCGWPAERPLRLERLRWDLTKAFVPEATETRQESVQKLVEVAKDVREKGWASSLFVVLAYYSGSHVEKCAVPIARAVGEKAVYVAPSLMRYRGGLPNRINNVQLVDDMAKSRVHVVPRQLVKSMGGMGAYVSLVEQRFSEVYGQAFGAGDQAAAPATEEQQQEQQAPLPAIIHDLGLSGTQVDSAFDEAFGAGNQAAAPATEEQQQEQQGEEEQDDELETLSPCTHVKLVAVMETAGHHTQRIYHTSGAPHPDNSRADGRPLIWRFGSRYSDHSTRREMVELINLLVHYCVVSPEWELRAWGMTGLEGESCAQLILSNNTAR
ncbi:hypothetical protein C2E21_5914 [Chlorella sorokiniana]|uniref:Uncharacterized protein n=1 Tax=Chlorella sorokiniana TaxID=3076 RepID=A0A2P6TM56_CHLSO|nr:hypothetical protein C2E21_5914 [Chlorella sorokiniana]|eukprot:PRW45420.1 hypothetical protein C2E21_5914 [Chlorella sorokiniana]